MDSAAEEDAVFVAALEVVHLACAAGFDPGVKALRVDVVCLSNDGGDACGVEAGLDGLFAQPLFEAGSPFSSE